MSGYIPAAVTRLIAGTNIALSPTGGEGIVTVSATGGGGGGVTQVYAGTAISVTGTTAYPIVNNTGVTSVTATDGVIATGVGAVAITGNPQAMQSLDLNSTLYGVTNVPYGTVTIVAGTAYYSWYPLTPGRTIATYNINVSALGVGGTAELGFYNDASSSPFYFTTPGTRLATLGTVSTASLGLKTITASTVLPGKGIWVAVLALTANCTVSGVAAQNSGLNMGLLSNLSNDVGCRTQSGLGSLPATATSVSATTALPGVFLSFSA